MNKAKQNFKKNYHNDFFLKNLSIFELETMNTITTNTWWWKNLRKTS